MPCPPASMVSDEKSAVIPGLSLEVRCYFSQLSRSFVLVLGSLTRIHLGMDFFGFILLRSTQLLASVIWGF